MSFGARDDSVLEDVPALVGERLERGVRDLLDGARVGPPRRRSRRDRRRSSRASARGGTDPGTPRSASRARGSRRAGRPSGEARRAPSAGRAHDPRIGLLDRVAALERADDDARHARQEPVDDERRRVAARAPASCRACAPRRRRSRARRRSSPVCGSSSTSGISATGLKKCMPTSAPISSTESDDVFVASTQSVFVDAPSSETPAA